jgi:hypothetical protein
MATGATDASTSPARRASRRGAASRVAGDEAHAHARPDPLGGNRSCRARRAGHARAPIGEARGQRRRPSGAFVSFPRPRQGPGGARRMVAADGAVAAVARERGGRATRRPCALTSPSPDYDVVVVGGGLAGTAFARTALTLGAPWRILVIDKARFPRDETCGDGLTYRAIPLVREIFPELHALLPSPGAVTDSLGLRPSTAGLRCGTDEHCTDRSLVGSDIRRGHRTHRQQPTRVSRRRQPPGGAAPLSEAGGGARPRWPAALRDPRPLS